jgi:hypothetical protein
MPTRPYKNAGAAESGAAHLPVEATEFLRSVRNE